MSILTSASSNSVRRGYDYYDNDKIDSIRQLSSDEYEGYVKGSQTKPYYVKINIDHPRKSYCDCPFADGNKTCKHMVALYFSIFPDEVEDYKDWLESDYDEYEEDDYYNGYDEYYGNIYSEKFEKPLFFDVVLNEFINSLSVEQLKKILRDELENDESRAYDKYLSKKYNKYLKNNNDLYVFLDKLNVKIKELTDIYDYNYKDFNDEILSPKEKKKISELYLDKVLQNVIDEILFVPELAVYSEYRWIANFYKKNKQSYEIENFSSVLENYLNSLKHYSIKNPIPKSNILITLYLLNNYSINELANSLLNNGKYLEYVDYVISNSKQILDLYNEFLTLINKNYFKNKAYIPDILYRFVYYTDFENEEINRTHYLYSYLCLGKIEYLEILSHIITKENVINEIEKNTKDIFLLIKLYNFYNLDTKLWSLLNNSEKKYLLVDNIEILKVRYSRELYEYFLNEFYETLKEDKNREVYRKASKYINAISKLDDGNTLVNKIINELKKSEYQKCSALFDEIKKVLD